MTPGHRADLHYHMTSFEGMTPEAATKELDRMERREAAGGMTDAQRRLLLALAKSVHIFACGCDLPTQRGLVKDLGDAIKAVEAEDADLSRAS